MTAATGCRSLLLGGTGGVELQEPDYKTVAAGCAYEAKTGTAQDLAFHDPQLQELEALLDQAYQESS